MARKFHDRHEWVDYLKACEMAHRIVADPSMIEGARQFIDARVRPDPHQRDYVSIWDELLGKSPEHIASALIEDSPRGQLLRETSPVFGKGLTSREVAELIAHEDAPPR